MNENSTPLANADNGSIVTERQFPPSQASFTRREPEYSSAARNERKVTIRKKKRKHRIAGWAISFIMTVLIIALSLVLSVYAWVNNHSQHREVAGSYTVVTMQRQQIEAKLQELAAQTPFSVEAAMEHIDVYKLSSYSQDVADWWFALLKGGKPVLPRWDGGPLRDALAADPSVNADELAQAITLVVDNTVFPLKQSVVALGISLVAKYDVMRLMLVAVLALAAAVAVLVLLISLVFKKQFMRRIWYIGCSLMSAGLVMLLASLVLRDADITGSIYAMNRLLGVQAESAVAQIISTMMICTEALGLLGAAMMTVYIIWHYRTINYTRHELVSDF